jgi:hypothetical protein
VKIRNKEYPHIGAALVFVIIVVSIWMAYLYVAFQALRAAPPAGISGFGQFGDTIGAINALFTGLALAGLVYTALLQHEQIQTQRQELEQQARDSEATRHALSREKREQFQTARRSNRKSRLPPPQRRSRMMVSDSGSPLIVTG